jgi:hypothetical protein
MQKIAGVRPTHIRLWAPSRDWDQRAREQQHTVSPKPLRNHAHALTLSRVALKDGGRAPTLV